MPSIKSTIKKFRAYIVPVVILNNRGKTIVIGTKLIRTANTLVNLWTLIGYEVHGNPTEIIGPPGMLGKKNAGVGYICDEQGVTVSLQRKGPQGQPEPLEVVFDTGEFIDFKLHAETIPFILLENNGLTLTWGGEIRKKGDILTNGPGQPAYRIKGEMVEIINEVTGKTAMGYICDESGVTVTISRDFRVIYPEPFDEKVREAVRVRNEKILKGEEVGIQINFSGAIGKGATFDRIPEIFDVGQSKKNLYVGIVMGLGIMFVLSRFF
jgi:hypothetical protein